MAYAPATAKKSRTGASSKLPSFSTPSFSAPTLSSPKKNKKKGPINKALISGPTDFKRVAHMGFDSDKGFTSENVDPSWQHLLTQLQGMGISRTQIDENKDFIQNFVREAGQGTAPGMPPPPPPPAVTSKRKAAPPAPRSRGAAVEDDVAAAPSRPAAPPPPPPPGSISAAPPSRPSAPPPPPRT